MSTITNQATIIYSFSGSTESLTGTSNTSSIELNTSSGLTITKTANPTTFSAGSIISYTVTITNSGSNFLTGVRIIDDLGGGNLAYVVGSGKLTVGSTSYAVSPIATNPLTFTLQQLNVGQTMTLTYNSQVIFNLPSTITAITNSVQGIGYTSTGTVTAFAHSTIQKKNSEDALTVSKLASETEVFPNQVFSYIITLNNNTSTDATVDSITDQLPTNFEINSVTLRISGGATETLTSSDYTLSSTNNFVLPSTTGPSITVASGTTTVVTITGYISE